MLVFVLYNCSQDETGPPGVGNETIDYAMVDNMNVNLEEFTRAFSLATAEKSFRQLIRDETNKQFDFDYDILYSFIRDKVLHTEEFGRILVKDLLLAKLNSISAEKRDMQYLDGLATSVPNLNICVPVQYEDWNAASYMPKVVMLPVDYDEKDGKLVKVFDHKGKRHLIEPNDDELDKPLIVLGMSERVDEKGMLRVDINGFVLHQEERTMTAWEAYENVRNGNARLANFVPIITYGDSDPAARSTGEKSNAESTSGSRIGIAEAVKATANTQEDPPPSCTAPPQSSIVQLRPSNTGSTLFLEYSQVTGAQGYRIYRSTNDGATWTHIATRLHSQAPTFVNTGLTSGQRYTYAIQSYSGTCNAPFSITKDLHATWREHFGTERIKAVNVSEGCWDWCESLQSKIELQYRLITYDKEDQQTEFPNISLGQTHKDDQKGKYYNYNETLFDWDFSKYAYEYRLWFWEDDTGIGTTTTVELGVEFPLGSSGATATASIEWEFKDNDEQLGYFAVRHYDGESQYCGNDNCYSPRYAPSVHEGEFKVAIDQI